MILYQFIKTSIVLRYFVLEQGDVLVLNVIYVEVFLDTDQNIYLFYLLQNII